MSPYEMIARVLTSALLLSTLLSAGCADGAGSADAGHDGGAEDGHSADMRKLASCLEPGKACKALDSCAIAPICGEDFLCRASKGYQDCDDGLACTLDICAGSGRCDHQVQKGSCVVRDSSAGGHTFRCVAANTANPDNACERCQPDTSQQAWSHFTGDGCDDGELCTRDDYCQDGVCRGVPYSCDDDDACTKDICDGKGGCAHPPEPESCRIGGTCYARGAFHHQGCARCDPSKSKTEWTIDANKCLIDDVCYVAGGTPNKGCGSCAPSTSNTTLTLPPNTCSIDKVCVPDGQLDTNGCMRCDISADLYDWTLQPSVQTTSFDFETPLSAISVSAPVEGVGWRIDTQRARNGAASIYYGNPKTYTLSSDNNTPNFGSFELPKISVPAGKKAVLRFWLWSPGNYGGIPYEQEIDVRANGQLLWHSSYNLTPGWDLISLKLAKYAGQNVTLSFHAKKSTAPATSHPGFYIDDIKVVGGCNDLTVRIPFKMDGTVDAGTTVVSSGPNRLTLRLLFKAPHLYLAVEDAGEGNDHIVFLSADAPTTSAGAPAPWKKSGTMPFTGEPYFLIDENDSSYSAWHQRQAGADVLIKQGHWLIGAEDLFAARTTSVNGGVLEGAINLLEVFGSIPGHVYVAAVPYATADLGALAPGGQTPMTQNSDGNLDASEVLKVALPNLTVVK